jgi:hypothetical protein
MTKRRPSANRPLNRPFKRILTVAAALLLLTGTASAQSVDSGVDAVSDPAPDNAVYKDLQPAVISLSRPAKGGKAGDFIIRLASRYGQSGCQHIGKVGYSLEFQDMYLNIGALQYAVDMDNLPLHPEYQCGARVVYPSAEIPLNVAMLKQNGTEQIRFQDTGESNYYDVIYGDHYIEIAPQPPKVFAEPRYQPAKNFGNVKNPLKVWLYPVGTVILRASNVPHGTNIRGQIDALARQHHLVPLDSVIKGFTSPIDDANSFYYLDKSKKLDVAKQEGIADGITLGTIDIPATVYGATGDESIELPVKIFAHTPSAYE